MMRCQNCNNENASTDVYCAQCGFPLTTFSDNTTQMRTNYETYQSPASQQFIPPPPPTAASTPSTLTYDYHRRVNEYSSTYKQGQYQTQATTERDGANQKLAAWSGAFSWQGNQQPKRTIGGYIFSGILGLWGVCWSALGMAGFLFGVLSNGLAVAIALLYLVVDIIVLIVALKSYVYPRLQWWKRLLWQGGAFLAGVVLLLIGAGIVTSLPHPYNLSTSSPSDFTYGSILFIYGLIAAFFALW